MKQTKNVDAVKGLSAAEREAISKAIERAEKRAAYQKVRNARAEVKAARKAYNRKRYHEQKALMEKAKALGLVK